MDYAHAPVAVIQEALADVGQIREFGAGFRFFDPGDSPPLFFLLNGLAKLVAIEEDGSERLIRFTHCCDFLGLPSAMVNRRPKYHAMAVTACRALVLPRDVTLERIRCNPPLNQAVMMVYVKTIAQLCAEKHVPRLPPEGQVAWALQHLARLGRWDGEAGATAQLALTQSELAAFLNRHRVTVSRALTFLQRQGAVYCARGRIWITDVEGLSRYQVGTGRKGPLSAQ